MKKLNKKGLGHHMLLALVAVVAVVGAAGYFVWQRQDEGIDAKAAGLAYIAPNSPRDAAISKKYLKMSACKNPSKRGKDYFVVSFGGQRLNKDVKVYTIRNNGKIWQDVYFSKSYAYPTSALQAYKTDSISMSWRAISLDYNYGSIQVSNIPNC